mgnify:CR=1 FL=1
MAKLAEQNLTAIIRALPAYQHLLASIQAKAFLTDQRRGLGLPRSARLALLSAIHQDLNRPILLLTNRSDRALSLFDELSFWIAPQSNLYFRSLIRFFMKTCPGRKAPGWTVCVFSRRLPTITFPAHKSPKPHRS